LWTDNGFFGPGQLTRTHFILQARSISQPSSKSTLPFAGLHYMKQCQNMIMFIFLFDSLDWDG
jgi:hypothetical protein